MSRQEDFIQAGIDYRMEHGKPMAIGGDNFAEMAKEMNYYIQGDCARAEEIKEAFKKLGCDVKGFDMCNNNILFFTYKLQTGGKVLSTTNANLYTANIIKTHPDYKELELPVEPKFKVGDWIKCIDDEGDAAVERIVNLRGNKVLLVDTDGCFTEYPKGELKSYHLWTIADAKDGDVLVTTKVRSCPFIYRKTSYKNNLAYYYVGINGDGDLTNAYPKNTLCHFGLASDVVPATKEQRDLLFAKMKEAGYKWDEEKKELRKIKPHYDIKNFHAGMPVLVRDNERRKWCYTLYSHYDSEKDYPFVTAGDSLFIQCVPYNDDTKHLLGTTDMCDEQYINW